MGRLRKGVIVALLVLALGLSAELLARRYYYARTYNYYEAAEVYWEEQSTLLLYIPHRALFWTLKPGIRFKAAETAELPELRSDDAPLRHYEWEIRVGPKGHRGPDFPSAKPSGELRVACFGDSRTIGESLAENETYPARLQALLGRALDDRPVRVLNLGADGWSSYQGLVLLRDHASYGIDVAVFAFGINDTDTDWGISDREKARLLDTQLVSIQRMLYRSTAFFWAQRQFLWARGGLVGKTRVQRPERDAKSPRAPRVSRDEYAATLRRIAAVCRERGITPILLVMPVNPYRDWVRWATAGGDYRRRYAAGRLLRQQADLAAAHAEFTAAVDATVFAAYNREAERVAAELGVVVVDATRAFFDVLRYEAVFADEMHPNPRGADLAARLVADVIASRLREAVKTGR